MFVCPYAIQNYQLFAVENSLSLVFGVGLVCITCKYKMARNKTTDASFRHVEIIFHRLAVCQDAVSACSALCEKNADQNKMSNARYTYRVCDTMTHPVYAQQLNMNSETKSQ